MKKTALSLTCLLVVCSPALTPAPADAQQGVLQIVDETPIILPPEPGPGTWYNSAAALHGSRWILYVQGHDSCPSTVMFDSLYYSISDTGPEGPWSQPLRLTPCSQNQPGIPWVGLPHVFGIGGLVPDYFPASPPYFPAMDLLTINYGPANDDNQNYFYYGAVFDGWLFKSWKKFLDTSLIGDQMSIADPVPVKLTADKFGFVFTYQDRRFPDQPFPNRFLLGYGVHDRAQKKTWVETTTHGWLQVTEAQGYKIPASAIFRSVNTSEWQMDVNQLSQLFDTPGDALKGYALYPTRVSGHAGNFRQREFHIKKNTYRWDGFKWIFWEYLVPNQGEPGCVPTQPASFPTGVGVDWFYSVDYTCDGSPFGRRAVVHGVVQPN